MLAQNENYKWISEICLKSENIYAFLIQTKDSKKHNETIIQEAIKYFD